MSNDPNLFREAIERQTDPIYRTQPGDIIEHYRERYGEKKWTRAIAEDIRSLGIIKNRKGEDVSVQSIMRRFQGDRLQGQMASRDTSLYKQVGEITDPVARAPKDGTLSFQIKGSQSDPYGGHRDRTINWTMSGTTAYDFANNPNWQDFWEDYDVDWEMMEDGDYEFSVGYVS